MQIWNDLYEMHNERFITFFNFKQFVETIPLSSVECERIFSCMNFIKDKRKNALSTRNLFYRIALKVHGKKVD